MKNYKNLRVWTLGMEIASNSYKLIKDFPAEERFGLSNQISRAAASIPSNIAEGSSRSSDKHYILYLENSLGSCFELETHLLLSENLEFGNPDLRQLVLSQLIQEQKMLHKLISSLKHKLIKP